VTIVVLVYFAETILEKIGIGHGGLTVAFIAAVLSLLSLTTFTVVYTASLVDDLTTERNKPAAGAEVRIFRDPVQFAIFRLQIVLDTKATGLTHAIHCTSHCNLFAQPGGSSDEINTTLRAINAAFFREMAQIVMDSTSGGLRLLLQYKDVSDFDVKIEIAERLRIWMEVCARRSDLSLKREQFSVQHLLPASLKDYFVIEDHFFTTIRKTPASGGSTHFVYVRNAAIAETYRDWLADVFSNGHHEDNAQYTRNDKQLDEFIKQKWEDLREADKFKKCVLKNDAA
jgi:hypothetical protein